MVKASLMAPEVTGMALDLESIVVTDKSKVRTVDGGYCCDSDKDGVPEYIVVT